MPSSVKTLYEKWNLRFNIFRKNKDDIADFVTSHRIFYESFFGKFSTEFMMQPLFMLAMVITIVPVVIGYELKTGSLVFLWALLPMSSWALFHFLLDRFIPANLFSIKLNILAFLYLSGIILVHLEASKYGEILMTNAEFTGFVILAIVLSSFGLFTPYLKFNFVLILLINVLISSPIFLSIANSRHLDILAPLLQANVFGFILSSLVSTVFRYRVFFVFQEKMLSEQKCKAESSDERIRKIFDSIDQAIFCIGFSEGRFTLGSDGVSPGCKKIIGCSDSLQFDINEDFFSKIKLNTEKIDRLKSSLYVAIGDTELTFSLNQEHLPRDIIFDLHGDERYLSLTYAPILHEGLVKFVLITASDRTDEQKQKVFSQKNEARIDRMMSLLSIGREKATSGLDIVDSLLKKAYICWDNIREKPITGTKIQFRTAENIYILLHTIKGNARSMNMNALALASHEAENCLEPFRSEKLYSNLDEFEKSYGEFLFALNQLSGTSKAYRQEIDALGWFQSTEVILPIESYQAALGMDSWTAIREKITRGEDPDRLLEKFLKPSYRRLLRLPEALHTTVINSSKYVQKPCPTLRYEGDDIWVTAAAFERLCLVLQHLLANSIDHGIEDASTRVASGKTPEGNILIFTSFTKNPDLENKSLNITISDDGHGIAPVDIARNALKKGVITEEAMARMSDRDKAAMILTSGISTKQHVTELSGRGVGLSAVLAEIKELGGKFDIILGSQLGKGRMELAFITTLPSKLVWAASDRSSVLPNLGAA